MRLKIVSYAVLGLFLATAGLAGTYYVQSLRQEAVIENLAGRVVTAEGQLKSAMTSLDEIEKSVEASDQIIGTLNDALGRITESDWMITERITMLERNNVQIRDLLSTRLPDNGCLLDNTCRYTGVPVRPTERSTDEPVRPAAPGPE